jgi:hypothetical protein
MEVAKTRSELLDELNEAASALHDLYRDDKGKDVSIFLLQSIALHADDLTLWKVVADINEHLADPDSAL